MFPAPKILYLSILLLYVLFPRNLWAGEPGFKFFANYGTGLNNQNWCVRQGPTGLIYVANNGKVIEYDGLSQRIISIPNKTAWSLAVDSSGTVYIGGINQFGYLAPDEQGEMKYVSLVHRLKEKQKNFGIIYRIHPAKEGVYFRAKKRLFRLPPGTGDIKVWSPPSGNFDASFYIGENYFVHIRGFGLMQMKKDGLQPVPANGILQQVKIYMFVPYDNRTILIGTRSRGFFLLDPVAPSIIPFKTRLDDFLREKKLYHGTRLSKSPDTFVMATLGGGAATMDSTGQIKEIFDRDYGLSSNVIYHVYEDRRGNIWLGHDKGLSKIEYHSPLSVYNGANSQLKGMVLSLSRHGADNRLYVGTNQGLSRLEPARKAGLPARFPHIPGTAGMYLSLLSTGQSLLAATDGGVREIRYHDRQGRHSIRSITSTRSFALIPSRKIPARIWVGTAWGLSAVHFKENRWQELFNLEQIPFQIRTLVEDKRGRLWLGTRTRGVFLVRFPTGDTAGEAKVTGFGEAHGLPAGEIRVFWATGRVIAASGKKVFRFDEAGQTFSPDPILGNCFIEGSRSIFRLIEDKEGTIWFHSEFKNLAARPAADGSYTLLEAPFLRIPKSQVNHIYPDPRAGAVWFAANDGLFRFDKSLEKKYDLPYWALIREVEVNGRNIFNGAPAQNAAGQVPELAYKDRNVQFRFAAPDFENESAIRFQSILEGYDKQWSPWSEVPWKNYTNLDPGPYTFRVKAINSHGHISRAGVYSFELLPPWYRTWWAYSLYVSFLLLTIALLVRWRSAKLHRETIRLEGIIKKRTGEIQDKNRQLEDQSEKLKEMDRVKSRFFANISHEFRTPLTLIMGPLEQMLGDDGDDNQQKPQTPSPDHPVERKRKLSLMMRNSQRLLNLINQLLELSKLESGSLALHASPQAIVPFVKGIVDSFEGAAQQKDLILIFKEKAGGATLYFDGELLEEVLCNLLGNAIKFTPPGGEIDVEVTCAKETLDISVSDNGPGIPREQLVHIFDRFYQAGASYENHRKGTGIGLAIAKELVELHQGSIDVHSREDEPSGTSFVIHLPQGKDHLDPSQIVETPEHTPAAPVLRRPPEEIPEPPPRISPDQVEESDKQIILVVEDSTDMRDYIRGALEHLYQVVEAGDGEEGLKKAGEIIPDLIISDVMMPRMDGFELCRLLKNQVETSHIPVILLTAKTAEDSVIEGLQTGADDYITKPFNTKILNARIKNLIDLRRQLQQRMQREMTLQPVKLPLTKIDEEFLIDLKEAMEKNMEDPDFNVDGLCKKLYMSRPTLYRKLKAMSGQSPTDYIRDYRLKRGAELLKSNFGSVTEIAFEVGFSSAAYFTKCFRDKFHLLPSSLRPSEPH